MTAAPIPQPTDPVARLLVELSRRGIQLRADGNTLRYRPRDRMTPELAGRLRDHNNKLEKHRIPTMEELAALGKG